MDWHWIDIGSASNRQRIGARLALDWHPIGMDWHWIGIGSTLDWHHTGLDLPQIGMG
jgi:hypothetical protein